MSKRTRIHPVQFYLNDDEQYILEEKYRLSRMKSKSAFLRKMILYGFVYEVDYSHIRKMNFPRLNAMEVPTEGRCLIQHPTILRLFF